MRQALYWLLNKRLWRLVKVRQVAALLTRLAPGDTLTLGEIQAQLRMPLLEARLLVEELEDRGLVVRNYSSARVAPTEKGRAQFRHQKIRDFAAAVLFLITLLAAIAQIYSSVADICRGP